MKTFWKFSLMLTVALLAVVGTANAITAVGEPHGSRAWTQGFMEDCVGDGVPAFDNCRILMGSGGPLQVPGSTGFSVGSGWIETLSTPTISNTAGPSTCHVEWTLNFEGSSGTPLDFYFQALSGATLLQSQHIFWSGTAWSYFAASWPLSVHNVTLGYSYASIGAAMAQPPTSGNVITVDPGTYPEGNIAIGMNLTIQASISASPPTITRTTDTGDPNSGDARAWFLVASGVTANFSNLEFDGSPYLVSIGILSFGGGTVSNCGFHHISWTPDSYYGRAIASYGMTLPLTVEDCDFDNIGRIGTFFFYANTGTKIYRRNTYTGKGTGLQLDYGVELGGGAVATVENSTITNCTGVAYDGSTSAGVLATTYFPGGTAGVFNGNIVIGNSYGFAIGYGATDVTTADAYSNRMENINEDVSNSSTTVIVDASGNWWGQAANPTGTPLLGAPAHIRPSSADGDAAPVNRNALDADYEGLVDYTPWLNVGTDINPSVGFQGDFSVLNVGAGGQQTGDPNRIQEGIDMTVGSTTWVWPGTYYAAQTLISSSENLLSTGGAAVTIIDGTGGTGLVNPGTIRITASDGPVTVDGFTIRNPQGAGASVVRVGIDCRSTTSVTYTITDNIIQGTNNPADAEDYGLYGEWGSENLVFTGNAISQTGANPILIENHTGATDVSNNSWDRGVTLGSNDGYFNMNHDAADITSLQRVANNNVNMGGGTYDFANRGFAITFAGAQTGTTGGFTNVQITNNTITNLQDYRRGIGLWNNAAVGTDGDIVGATISGNQINGTAGTVGGIGIRILGQHTGTLVTGNNISHMATALQATQWNGPYPTGSQVTGNSFSNAGAVVLTDDGTTSYWDSNCYSDYGSNCANVTPNFDYDIDHSCGTGYLDANPNVNACANADFLASSAYIGCPAGCDKDTLYLTFDQVGYINGQVIIQLPAEFDGDWAAGPAGVSVFPASNVATNLTFSQAGRVGVNQIEVNVAWGPPYSDGDGTKYIAAIPIKNVSGADGVTYTIYGVSSLFSNPAPHVNEFALGFTTITVDCTGPTATLSTAPACAYNSAAAFQGQLTTAMSTLGAPLANAYVTVTNGTPASFDYPVSLVGGAWPTAGDIAAVWAFMTEGCNTFALHAFDTECNEGVSTPVVTVIKDTVVPAPTFAYTQSACYNNISGDPQYGPTLLVPDLDVNLAAAAVCQASTFSMTLTFNAGSPYTVLSGVSSIASYPDAAQAATFWTDLVATVGTSYSGDVTVGWTVTDCAGNAATGSFLIPCVDFINPDNVFIEFDARPTYDGVWLKWTWAFSDAPTAMEVWRKGEGDYPVYASNLSMADANYEKVHANLVANGWTMAATQTGAFTSGVYPGTHGGPLSAYWKDNISDLTRDIYRYVTFVKDAAGNWSQVASYTLLTNADRSTNYWLGDFAPLHGGPPGPVGIVDGPDLGLLSAHYFEAVLPGFNYLDIGPENSENGYGKGIPNPDQFVNFLDLMPFSFNYGVVSSTGFNVLTPRANPDANVDAQPVVTVTRANNNLLEVGDEFEVVVSLSGNSASAVKAVETQLTFDPQVLEMVNVSSNTGEVYDGIGWSTARQIAGSNDRIGIAVAAMGEIASFVDDFTMATITFRWIADRIPETSLGIESYQLADVFGHTFEGEGAALHFGASGVIPTVFALYQNYPNPFNPSTLIRLDLPEVADVQLVIYNIMGQEVRTLVSATMPAGAHSIAWNGLDNSGQMAGTGMYIYRVSAGPLHDIKKMLLTR